MIHFEKLAEVTINDILINNFDDIFIDYISINEFQACDRVFSISVWTIAQHPS